MRNKEHANNHYIEDYIPYGRENATHLRELATLLRIDTRSVKNMIQKARRRGIAIMSDCEAGYWISDDPEEIKLFIARMEKSAKERFITVKTIRKIVDGRMQGKEE